ncbi:MAG: hypothetical protein IPJ51_01865 [Saprospiraceae bacterium]|nr:hypothetical protein [Saprospiraceae bacterium]
MLALTGEAQYLNLSYAVDNKDDLDQLPHIDQPSLDDVLESAIVSQPFMQYSLGIKYHFLRGKSLQPYISYSIIGQRILENTYDYTYRNKLTQKEISVEFATNETKFVIDKTRAAFGLNFRFYDNYSALLEAAYDFKISQGSQFKSLVLVKAGLMYKF